MVSQEASCGGLSSAQSVVEHLVGAHEDERGFGTAPPRGCEAAGGGAQALQVPGGVTVGPQGNRGGSCCRCRAFPSSARRRSQRLPRR